MIKIIYTTPHYFDHKNFVYIFYNNEVLCYHIQDSITLKKE